MMLLRTALQLGLLVASAPSAWAASSWGFSDATVSIQTKGAGVGTGFKETLTENKPLSNALSLGASDTVKVLLTTKEGSSAKIPHQAFLQLKDADTGLDYSYPFSVKDSGKSKVELTQKDLPSQFLSASKTLDASFVIGSFGDSKAYNSPAFQLAIDHKGAVAPGSSETVRYGKLDEIHHIFKSDAQSPPVVVSLVFTAAVLATLPVLAGIWLYLGANVNHLTSALKSSPLSHAVFFGSLASLEGIFFLYYTSWNLFQTLPAVLGVGVVACLSGSRALSEVQERRLSGLR
ncbi:hypothetical protein FQN54_001852 [Arachnomyces sp. PD_36]|nr:hypothetical protein FQN54_001852 [Arachnomyces sp. PD_36]